MAKYIKDLSVNTAPDETDAVEIDDGVNSEYVTIRNLVKKVTGYTLYGQLNNSAPADATTYYFGSPFTATILQNWMTTARGAKLFIPKSGTITRVDVGLFIASGGTLGTTETSTLSLRLNDTTDTTLSAVMNCSARETYYNVTGLSVAVAAGDFIEFKWVTPTWATNPVGVYINCQVWVE